MSESDINAKGQTTVPAKVRALIQAKPGTKLVWSVTPHGTVIVRVKTEIPPRHGRMLKGPRR